MLSTDKQTDKQTDRQTNQRYQKHNLLCQGVNYELGSLNFFKEKNFMFEYIFIPAFYILHL